MSLISIIAEKNVLFFSFGNTPPPPSIYTSKQAHQVVYPMDINTNPISPVFNMGHRQINE
ncbi:hypothetical protein DERP_001599 [Dermatophagoides pteronyssinus]|uniref:Uncharacterized protein n=1 Tax=Dermatophagoides pteronyssinus TaxID=6956 RepID=A0ABQ8JB02_DERPT|nr:hypothetical protein DERP_001599 [Dermatophagoides pteronyssinus]